MPIHAHDAHPLAFVLADADVEVLVGGHVYGCLVLLLLYHLDAISHLAVQVGQALYSGLSAQHPVNLQGVFAVELAVLQIDVVAHVVGVGVALEHKYVVAGYRDGLRCYAKEQTQQQAECVTPHDFSLHIYYGLETKRQIDTNTILLGSGMFMIVDAAHIVHTENLEDVAHTNRHLHVRLAGADGI